MKCCFVKDLLPDYIEGLTCGAVSEEMKKHLEICPACHAVYEQMTDSMPQEAYQDDKNIDFLKKLKARIRKKYMYVALLTCAALICLFVLLNRICLPLPYDPDSMSTDLYQAVPVTDSYGITRWEDVNLADSESLHLPSIDLVRLAVTGLAPGDSVISSGRTIERDGEKVRLVYYCYTRTLWSMLSADSVRMADSMYTTSSIYGNRLENAEYIPLMTEIYYLPTGNMNRLDRLSDQEFEDRKEDAVLVWSGVN